MAMIEDGALRIDCEVVGAGGQLIELQIGHPLAAVGTRGRGHDVDFRKLGTHVVEN